MWHIIGPNPWWICNGHQYTPYPRFRFFPILPTFWRLSQTIWEAERPTLLVLRPKNRIRRQWRFQMSHIYFHWSVNIFIDCQITSNGTNVWNRGVEFHMSKFGVGAYSYTQVNSKVCQKHSKINMRQLFRIPIFSWNFPVLTTLCPEFHSGGDISIAFHDHWNHAPVPVAKKCDDCVVLISLSADKRGLPFVTSQYSN